MFVAVVGYEKCLVDGVVAVVEVLVQPAVVELASFIDQFSQSCESAVAACEVQGQIKSNYLTDVEDYFVNLLAVALKMQQIDSNRSKFLKQVLLFLLEAQLRNQSACFWQTQGRCISNLVKATTKVDHESRCEFRDIISILFFI